MTAQRAIGCRRLRAASRYAARSFSYAARFSGRTGPFTAGREKAGVR